MKVLIIHPQYEFLSPNGELRVHNWREVRAKISEISVLAEEHGLEIVKLLAGEILHPVRKSLSKFGQREIPEVRKIGTKVSSPVPADFVCGVPWKEVLRLHRRGMILKDCLGHYGDLELPPGYPYGELADLYEILGLPRETSGREKE